MSLVLLNRAQAFHPGASVWVVPAENPGPLIGKMDWYLNFQLTRSLDRQPEDLSPQLKFIVTENNIPQFSSKSQSDAPLMISAERGLPTSKFIMLPGSDKMSSWTQKIHEIWVNLDHPTLRVFLPSQNAIDEFRSNWKSGTADEVQMVLST